VFSLFWFRYFCL